MEQIGDKLLTLLESLPWLFGQIMGFLNTVELSTVVVLIASLLLSVVLALSKNFIEHKWNKVPSETKMFLTNVGGIVAIAFGEYMMTSPTTDPMVAIASLVGLATVVQQPFYFKVVKPIVNRVMSNFWEIWERGVVLSDDLTSAAVPENGLPIETK